MFERLTDRARAAVIQARATAAERGDQIRPVYLLHAVALGEGTAARALAGLGIDAGTIERQLDRAAPRGRPLEGDLGIFNGGGAGRGQPLVSLRRALGCGTGGAPVPLDAVSPARATSHSD
ncbi:MAG TPA: Clp protease N-terminal domain-containing protein, partial [Streptosporangiaceae bacterium]|nr:Clp protease N-terminal domain-containing protein [Streptosporangiaceae bacterium]